MAGLVVDWVLGRHSKLIVRVILVVVVVIFLSVLVLVSVLVIDVVTAEIKFMLIGSSGTSTVRGPPLQPFAAAGAGLDGGARLKANSGVG